MARPAGYKWQPYRAVRFSFILCSKKGGTQPSGGSDRAWELFYQFYDKTCRYVTMEVQDHGDE